MKVLFLASYPDEIASTRYRIMQYLPYLRSMGFQCDVIPFLSSQLQQDLYTPGGMAQKSLKLLGAMVRRVADVLRASRYDVIFISREAMLFGPPVIEWLIHHAARRPIIFDFDDAIFVPYASPTYGGFTSWVKCAWKTDQIVMMSQHVLAGNAYLAAFAKKYHSDVTILPTVVDMEQFTAARPEPRQDSRPVIGWIGSHSSTQYLELLVPALKELAHSHNFIFRTIGAASPFESSYEVRPKP